MRTTPDPPIIVLGDLGTGAMQAKPMNRAELEQTCGEAYDNVKKDAILFLGAERRITMDGELAYGCDPAPDDRGPLFWCSADDLDNPVVSRLERIEVDRELGLFPTWVEKPLELVPLPDRRTSFGVVRGAAVKRWSAAMFSDVARESYFLARFAGPPRSPDLYERPQPRLSWRARLREWRWQLREKWGDLVYWWRYERRWPFSRRDDE